MEGAILCIGVVTMGSPNNEHCLALNRLLARLYRGQLKGCIGAGYQITAGCHLPAQRDEQVLNMLNGPYTHMLFIDDDVSFHPDAVELLISRKLPIVGGNYSFRKWPPEGVAIHFDGTRVPLRASGGVEKVRTIPLGLSLIERQVFEAMPKPRFLFGYNRKADNGKGAHCTEDHMFCRMARIRGGFDSYIDHDASALSVRHHGSFAYELPKEGTNGTKAL